MAKNRALARALTALLLSLCACLIFCACNTPLGPSIGSDNAMYLTMGTALARGYAPYTEIFDHKGPLLFLLEMLPQLFFGGYQTTTVVVMEWLFLFASLLVIERLCTRLHVRGALAAQLVYLAVLLPCMDGGNLGEEYANLFALCGLLLMLRAFDGEERRGLFRPAIGMGALATLCFLTRANNALALLGATAGLALCLLARREWANLGACAAGFSLGCAAALIPTALWLARYGALSEAFYGAIVHNLMYARTEGGSRLAMLLTPSYGGLAMVMAVLASLGALCCLARTRRADVPLAMLLGALGAGAGAFISHKFYMHYLMLGAPMAALGAAQMLRFCEDRSARLMRAVRAAALAICCVSLLASGFAANAQRLADLEGMERFSADAQALYAQVPEEDRASFMAYRVEPKWYVYTGALPCMRFYFLQEILGQADPRVMDEVAARFESDPPKWLVLFYERPFSPPYDARVQAVIDADYEFVDAQGEYQLLRLVTAQ